MRIVADIDIPFLQGVFEPFAQSVQYYKGNEIGSSEIEDADLLIIRTRTQCNAQLLEHSKVSAIATASIGTDHIDLDYCKSKGIKVISAPGCNSGGVLQWVLSATFSLLSQPESQNLSALTFGIVGVGNIGKRIERAVRALGFKVLLCDPLRQKAEGGAQFTSLDQIARKSDIISLHVPITYVGVHKTYHMVNKGFLDILKPNMVLLNSSRGGVVDEQELLKTLGKKPLRLGCDVWEDEPNINANLLRFAQVATPHIAGYSLEGKVNATRMVVEAIAKHFGLSINVQSIRAAEESSKLPILIQDFVEDSLFRVAHFFNSIYSISDDSIALKSNPKEFERLRNNYNLRREYSAYAIGDSVAEKQVLGVNWFNLGFE